MNILGLLNAFNLGQQKIAWHSLKKNMSFYVTIVATVSITVGILLCVITLNDLLLRKPLPYPHQERVMLASSVIYDQVGASNSTQYSYPELVELFVKQHVFESAAIISYENHEIASLPDQPSVLVAFTTSSFANVFGMKMAVGNFHNEGADIKSRIPGAVISYDVWRDHFNLRNDILEQNITIRSVNHKIIGVVSKDFIAPQIASIGAKTQVWLPWDFNTTEEGQRLSWSLMDGKYFFIGMLPVGLSEYQAEQNLTSVISDKWREGVTGNEFYRNWNVKIKVQSLQNALLGSSRPWGLMLLAGTLGLMLIACVNISNLFMLRAAEKQRDFAIRAAVGARKFHLLNLFFAESAQLMGVSLFFSLLVSFFGFEVMRHYFDNLLPRTSELNISFVTFFSAILITLFLAYLFALLSASVINYKKLNTYLSGGGKGTGAQVSSKVRSMLIVVQVALAVVLIVINVSLLQRSIEVITEDKGFDVSNTSSLLVMTSESSWPSQKDTFTAMEELKRKILSLPEVDGFSRSSGPLVPSLTWGVTIPSTNQRFTPFTIEADNGYFDLVKQRVLYGRDFTAADLNDWSNLFLSDTEVPNATSVLVVDESFAKKIAGGVASNAIGMKVTYSEGWMTNFPFTVIGVVNDIKHRAASEERPTIYMPRFPGQTRSIIKYKNGQQLSREALVRLLSSVDKRYLVSLFDKSDDLYNRILFVQIATAIVTSVLTALVFFMATVGLYGVLSYGTQLRKIELGTRMAIGAKRSHLRWLVLKGNMVVFLIGLVSGCALFLFAYFGFHNYVNFNFDLKLIPVLLVAFFLVFIIVLFGCYWPLRAYIHKPISSTLRLGE